MRHHRGVAGLVRHLDGGERLGQRTDLVDLDQDRIGQTVPDTLREPRNVGDKQIVADQLALVADQVGNDFPALEIVLGHAILDRDDGIGLDQVTEIVGLLLWRARLALAGIDIGAVFEELTRGRIERQHHVAARLVPGLLDGLHDQVERGFRRFQIGRKTALVADIGVEAGGFELRFQGVEDFRAGAQGFRECRRADRHDHKFLEVDRIVGMHAAIHDVHHRHRQSAGGGAADVAVERRLLGGGRGFGDRERHAENGVGAEPAFVRSAVERDQRFVDLGLRLGLHAAKRVIDLAVDRIDRLQDALAAVTRLVAVAQFDRFVRSGRGARGHCGAAFRAILQDDVDFDGRIAAAVEDFAADNVGNGGHGLIRLC